MDRQRGGLMRQPDKRGAAAGQANKKTLNRMDSMGYGVRSLTYCTVNLDFLAKCRNESCAGGFACHKECYVRSAGF